MVREECGYGAQVFEARNYEDKARGKVWSLPRPFSFALSAPFAFISFGDRIEVHNLTLSQPQQTILKPFDQDWLIKDLQVAHRDDKENEIVLRV